MLRTKLVPPLALLALLAGCADPAKRPAEEAVQGTEATLAGARADAARYAPEQLKAAEEGLAEAKAAYAKGDFKGALAGGQQALAKAKAAAAAATARREGLGRDFAMAGAQLPQVFEVIQGQLATLATAKKLPKGVTPAKLAAARDDLAAITKALDEATAKATAGDLPAALEQARPLRARTLALASSIGLELGGARSR
jgi:hypothetical protein